MPRDFIIVLCAATLAACAPTSHLIDVADKPVLAPVALASSGPMLLAFDSAAQRIVVELSIPAPADSQDSLGPWLNRVSRDSSPQFSYAWSRLNLDCIAAPPGAVYLTERERLQQRIIETGLTAVGPALASNQWPCADAVMVRAEFRSPRQPQAGDSVYLTYAGETWAARWESVPSRRSAVLHPPTQPSPQ